MKIMIIPQVPPQISTICVENDLQQSQEVYFEDIPSVPKEICLLLSLPEAFE